MEALLDFLGHFGVIALGSVLVIVAILGSILPALPGAPFALVAIFMLHFTGLHRYEPWVLILAVVLTILIMVVDYVVPILGTKKYGGSKAGVRGTTLGLVAGLILSLLTSGFGAILLIIGPFAGAYIGERYFAKAPKEVALRSAWGSFVGFLAGTAGKVMITLVIGFIFVVGAIKSF